MPARKVLISGVYGLIAGAVYEHLSAEPERYETHALARRRHPSVRVPAGRDLDIPEERFVQSNLSNLDELVEAVRGMDVVVHMAAEPSAMAGWDKILPSNIIGAYHMFEACRLAGVERIIYASSITVTFGYREVEPYRAAIEGRFADIPTPVPVITHELPARPRHLYACSKVFGEALAQLYAHEYGLSCLCLRIGWVVGEDRPPSREVQGMWCSQRDIVQLVRRCVDAPDDVRFDIFFGVSDNRWRWVDIEHARQVVGYAPQDHGEDWFPAE